jgi:chromosome segregation ATPase
MKTGQTCRSQPAILRQTTAGIRSIQRQAALKIREYKRLYGRIFEYKRAQTSGVNIVSAYEKYMAELPEDVERLEAEIERLTARNKLLEDMARAAQKELDESCPASFSVEYNQALAKLQEQNDD